MWTSLLCLRDLRDEHIIVAGGCLAVAPFTLLMEALGSPSSIHHHLLIQVIRLVSMSRVSPISVEILDNLHLRKHGPSGID